MLFKIVIEYGSNFDKWCFNNSFKNMLFLKIFCMCLNVFVLNVKVFDYV